MKSQIVQATNQLTVEGDLKKIRWSIHFLKKELSFSSNSVLQFTHTYSYPIIYHLIIEENSSSQRMQAIKSDNFIGKSLQTVLFDIDDNVKRKLGAGMHPFTLVLENNVSSVLYNSNFFLNQPISQIEVSTSDFVGVSPSSFFVYVKFNDGAPIHVILRLFKRSTNKTAATLTSYCERRCGSLVLNATLSEPGPDYAIDALAENHLSTASSKFGPFVVTPLVYDVFVTSIKSIVVDKQIFILFFLLGDLGDYTVQVHVKERLLMRKAFSMSSLAPYRTKEVNFPGNPSNYRVLTEQISFSSGGEISMRIEVSNILKTTYVNQKILVLLDHVCEVSARIRDGNFGRWQRAPLEVGNFLRLVGASWCRCKHPSTVKFLWNMYRVDSIQEIPKAEKKIPQNNDVTKPEIDFCFDKVPSGYYVVEFLVSTFNHGSFEATGYHRDFTLIYVKRRMLDLTIEGGSERLIGECSKGNNIVG